MSKIGINFRDSVGGGGVTDGAGQTYCVNTGGGAAEAYPTTRGGATFGWTTAGAQTRDRDSAVDPRLAGEHFWGNDGSQGTFRVDLPATGDYVIELAVGDATSAQDAIYVQLLDNTTPLLTVQHWPTAIAGGDFFDATDVRRGPPASGWVLNQVAVTKTFATTTLKLILGNTTNQVNGSPLAHLSFVAAAAAVLGRSFPAKNLQFNRRASARFR